MDQVDPVAEFLRDAAPLSPEELNALQAFGGDGVRTQDPTETLRLVARVVTYGVVAASRERIRSEYEDTNENYSDGSLVLVEGDIRSTLTFVLQVLHAWRAHADWAGEGYRTKGTKSAPQYVQVAAFCGRYFKAIRLYKTEQGSLLGWGDSDFQRLLRQDRPAGVDVAR